MAIKLSLQSQDLKMQFLLLKYTSEPLSPISAIFRSLLFLTLCLPTISTAQEDPALASSKYTEIAQNPTWLRLTHLDKRAFGRYRTDIQSAEFFLSKPPYKVQAELEATISAFRQNASNDNEQHAICRFPARYYWLKTTFPSALGDTPPLSICKKLIDWPAMKSGSALNLVHVSGYMGNPGSAFGHLLLRVGKEDNPSSRGLLDIGVNFGAKIPQGENTLLYILKGIGGGYNSSFSADRHYLRDHVYAASESRDMWAYELNLTEEKRQLLLLHLWELRDTAFNYFFLKKNCAWRIAQMLELVLNEDILPEHRLYYMPVDVFHAIEEIDARRNHKLVNRITFLPSDKRSNTLSFGRLPIAAQDRIRNLISNPRAENLDMTFTTPSLDFLIDYSVQAMAKEQDKSTVENWKKLRQKSLLLRLKTKSRQAKVNNFQLPPPGEGLRHQVLKLSTIEEESGRQTTELSFAPFSYELLDRNRGSLSNGEFRGGVFTFSNSDKNSRLKSIDVLKIARLRGMTSIERQRLDFAWRGGLLFNREWRTDPGRLRPQFNAAIGSTIGKGKTSLYGLLELKSNLQNFELQSGIVIGAVSLPKNKWSLSWESSIRWDEHKEHSLLQHNFSTRYRLNRAHALEASHTRQEQKSWKLSYQYRW